MTDVRVPDIGDFTDVPVIEVHVSPGDEVAAEDPLITLESDKATMDVPAPSAGVVKQLCVQIGDRVSEGSVILSLEGNGAGPSSESVEHEPGHRLPQPRTTAAGITMPRWWSSARVRAATAPLSGPPTWA